MYLISLSQWDYVWITAFLAANFIIAYMFRRKNQSSDAFLFATTKIDSILPFFGSFGLIEMILAGVCGAYFGVNAIYYIVLALVIQMLGQQLLFKRYQQAAAFDFNDYIAKRFNKIFAIMVAVFTIMLLVLCLSLAIAILFKSLQAVMGWGFINNTMGLLGLSVIFVLVGGRAAISYNKLLNSIVIFLIFVIAIAVAVIKLGGFGSVVLNLNKLAVAQSLPMDYYLQPSFNQHISLIILAIIIGFAGFKLVFFSMRPVKQTKMSVFGRIGVTILLVLPGILAIATPTTSHGIAGKEIVTIMAQLPDGQTGYVVKAVDNQSKQGSSAPGIIPPQLNPKTSLLEPGQYNFELANIVSLRHYLPREVTSLVLLILLAGFVLTVTDYMLKLGRVTVNNVLLPLNLIAKYGKIGELWSLQVSIVSYTGLTLIVSYFLFLHYNLLLFTTLITGFMILPLTLLIGMIMLLTPDKSNKHAKS